MKAGRGYWGSAAGSGHCGQSVGAGGAGADISWKQLKFGSEGAGGGLQGDHSA